MVAGVRVWLQLQLVNCRLEDWVVEEIDRQGDTAQPLAHPPSGGDMVVVVVDCCGGGAGGCCGAGGGG